MTRYRPLYPRIHFLFLCAGPLMVTVFGLASIAQSDRIWRMLMLLGMALVGWYVYRCFTVRVDIIGDSVHVRNPLSSTTFDRRSARVVEHNLLGFRWLSVLDPVKGQEYLIAATMRDSWLKLLGPSPILTREQDALVDELLATQVEPD